MGKKNRLKQLIGRFNKETNCAIKALPYSFDGDAREMLVKVDLDHDNRLAIANVPYFLDESHLKELCFRSLSTPVAHVQMTSSTALHGDIKKGYRSGYLVFATIQARRRAFDAISPKPFRLEDLDLELPAWHKPLGKLLGKRRRKKNDEFMEVETAEEERSNVDISKPDKDGWITVKKEHKFSFRGKINRPSAEGDGRRDELEMNVESALAPPKKRRKR